MPAIDNTLVSYENGRFVYEIPEWVMDHLMDIDRAPESPLTYNETTFVMDWRVDNDPRLVTEYIECQSVTMMDRTNDVYLNEVTRVTVPNDPVVKDVLFGYDSLPTVGDRLVRCWYCKPADSYFSYREFTPLCPQAYDEERLQRAFCYAMLEHFQSHRDAGDLPYVTTYFPGKVVYRPNGSIAAERPGVVRTWKINGGLLGPSQKWFDPTVRDESIAATDKVLALVE